MLGTLRYLSPERLRGGPATPGSDVYALGVVIHEMLGGEHGPRGVAGTPGAVGPARHADVRVTDLLAIAASVVKPDPGARLADAAQMRRLLHVLAMVA